MRERHVYPTHEIAHLWASQNHDNCRNPQDNLSFRGRDLYSYRTVIARITAKDVVLLTTCSYSNTTNGHMALARRACSHKTCINVPDVLASRTQDHMENMKALLEGVAAMEERCKRARVYKDSYWRQANELADEAELYAKTFLPRHKFNCRPQAVAEELKKRTAKEAKAAQRALKLQKEREKKARIESAEHLERWVAGEEGVYYSNRWYHFPVRLRIYDDNVDTSHGASVSILAARKLFRMCLICKKKGTHIFPETPVRIGSYHLNEIDPQGNVTVGCHKISFEEMERINGLLGPEGVDPNATGGSLADALDENDGAGMLGDEQNSAGENVAAGQEASNGAGA